MAGKKSIEVDCGRQRLGDHVGERHSHYAHGWKPPPAEDEEGRQANVNNSGNYRSFHLGHYIARSLQCGSGHHGEGYAPHAYEDDLHVLGAFAEGTTADP